MLADFLTPMAAVGLAELGDKTQVAIILMASRTKSRWRLLAGVMLGFLLVDGAAVALGSLASFLIPVHLVKTASGLLFILFGAIMLRGGETGEEEENVRGSPFFAGFTMIFAAEWGDKTQVAAGLFAAEYDPLLVLAGAITALAALSAAAVWLSGKLSERIDKNLTGKVAGGLFIVLGLLSLLL
jgi:Ca2+/H+ antiporter, TMEM165/GDT1 family